MNWNEILQSVVYPALAGVITTILGLLVAYACDILKRWAANLKHTQAVGIVTDAVSAAWSKKIKPSLTAKLSDGKITDQEWADLKAEVRAEAHQIATDRLKDLRGFAPSNIGKWVEAQVDVALGKLLGWVLNGEEPETDPLANAPASAQ